MEKIVVNYAFTRTGTPKMLALEYDQLHLAVCITAYMARNKHLFDMPLTDEEEGMLSALLSDMIHELHS